MTPFRTRTTYLAGFILLCTYACGGCKQEAPVPETPATSSMQTESAAIAGEGQDDAELAAPSDETRDSSPARAAEAPAAEPAPVEAVEEKADSSAHPAARRPAMKQKARVTSKPGQLQIGAPLQPAPAPLVVAPEFNTEGYDHITENRFLAVSDKPLSTFSIDVDTASYSNVRRMLNQGSPIPKGAVRVEELINYFSYDYPQPEGDKPFSVTTEVGAAPWNPKHQLVHIGLQGRRISQGALPARNLVFLLDVSGSMGEPNKLPLLKRSFAAMVDTLTSKDHVSIVVYAGASGLVLPPTRGDDKQTILEALSRLEAGGGTNGASGIELAYQVAQRHLDPKGVNRVVLATDGDFNVGPSSRSELVDMIEDKRKSGVYLTVLGFGMGNYKDSSLETLADKGNGNYAYIDSFAEARKVLIEEAGATLVTIAKDVKIQVEFNPKYVGAYRLIGYENRRLQNEDFNDDSKDAGEIGAGHTVTALYELVPPAEAKRMAGVDALKYQKTALTRDSNELMTVKLRYKAPNSEKSKLLSVAVDRGSPKAKTSDDFRFSAAVAAFGMVLRDSEYRGSADLNLAQRLAQGALGHDPNGRRSEFVSLVARARPSND